MPLKILTHHISRIFLDQFVTDAFHYVDYIILQKFNQNFEISLHKID